MKPMIFNTKNIGAILDGRKNQTRRIIAPSNSYFDGGPVTKVVKEAWKDFDWDNAYVDPGPSPAGNIGPYLKVPYPKENTVHRIYPKYSIGDKLWVKETFKHWYFGKDGINAPGIMYKANMMALWRTQANQISDKKWRSPRYMPRWASRITLEIKDIRAERVQDITPIDAVREGCPAFTEFEEADNRRGLKVVGSHSPIEQFQRLWDSINLSRGYGYDVNPWVFVVVFEKIDQKRSNDG